MKEAAARGYWRKACETLDTMELALAAGNTQGFRERLTESSSNRTALIVRASCCRSPASLEAGCGRADALRRHQPWLGSS